MVFSACVVLVLLGAAATVSGQDPPRPCCLDNQYSVDVGVVGETITDDPSTSVFIDGYINMGFDYYRDRQGLNMHFRQADGTMTVRYQLKDYATRRMYTKEANNTCTYVTIPDFDQLRAPCIPQDATFLGTSTFGYGHNSIEVNTWQFDYPLSAVNDSRLVFSVSKQHCVPITESIIGNVFGTVIEEALFYTNYHPGLEHLNDLDIPDNCVAAN